MFDNSVSVISSISRSLKKYLFILGIATQILFISYYIYLVVTKGGSLPLLILFSFVLFFAVVALLIDIFTVDITSFKSKIVKKNFKRVINYFSWICKVGVIAYNIYYNTTHAATEASMMFLIFSSIFLIVQIIASLFNWLFSYYSELFMYALKMDYINIIDEKEDPNQRPIGQALNKYTNQKDHRDKINELAIKHELYGSIKDELQKEQPIKFNGRIVKRKQAERIILRYYRKASRYYSSPKKIKNLLDVINNKFLNSIYNNNTVFLLEFFLHNAYDHIYVGLSEHAVKLIIACFLFLLDDNNPKIIDVVYKALLKEIIDIDTWSKKNPRAEELSKSNSVGAKYDRAIAVAKETKEQYELYKEETIGSEFESLIFKVVKDTAIENGKLLIKRKFKDWFKKK